MKTSWLVGLVVSLLLGSQACSQPGVQAEGGDRSASGGAVAAGGVAQGEGGVPAGAAAGEAPAGSAAAAAASARAAAAAAARVPRDAEQRPTLTSSAQALDDAGRPLEAWHLLVDGLGRRLDDGAWDEDGLLTADGEVAAQLLTDLTEELNTWPEIAEALAPMRRHLDVAPPEVAFRLERLYATALRNTGRIDEARAVIDSQGAVADYQIIGPFANERGGGFDASQPPEQGVDLTAAMPGKEREVRWRPNPCADHPLQRVLLHELLRPNEQSLAYLASAVHGDEPATIVLRLGSSGPFKVFWNGSEVASRNVERPHEADQDRVVLALQPGWNQLLIKSCVEDKRWTLETRFTDLEGRPLPDLVVDSGQAGRAAVPFVAASGTPRDEAPQILARLSEHGEAEAARLLALYHLGVHPDDVVDRSARTAAERALELAPDDVAAQYLIARANEPEGASEIEMEVNRRLHALEATLKRDPQHVGALLDLADFSMQINPIPARAGEASAAALAAAPASWRALMSRAEWLNLRSRRTEAEQLRQQALLCGEAATREDALLAAAALAREQGERDLAIRTLQGALDRHQVDGPVLEALVNAEIDGGHPEQALALVQGVLPGSPFAVDRMLETAERLEHAGRAADAAALVARALVVCPESTEALRASERLSERSGDLAAAGATLEEVVRLDPGDTRARRHRELLLAGEDVERFEAPWRRDAVALAATPMPGDAANEPVECLDRTVVWRVNSDGTEHEYEHIVLRVLNQGGVKQLDNYSIPSRGDTRPHVYNVRVIHPDGSAERAPPSRGSWRWYDLPPLRPGDLVDVEYRLDEQQADVFGDYFGTRHEFYPDLFDGWVPTRRSELVVLAPPDVPLYASERNGESLQRERTTDADGLTVLSWVATDLERPPMESKMPGRSELAPVVDVTTFKDWDAFASWWWAFIQKEFVTTPAMKAKVAELTAGLTTESEKVAAITRFVGQEIRYNAWPFGTHGYEPFSAATIFERRFGDCKDKSILLRQLLKEVGVDAVPVLLNAEYERADEPLSSAMVGLFNHCIAYVQPTADRPGYYLDATADHNPIDYLRADDQGARVLHVSGAGGAIHDIPYAPPEQNTLHRRYEVALDDQGDGAVTLRDDSNGYFAVAMRHRYGGETGDLNEKLARQLAEEFGQVEVAEAKTSDLEDITQPAWLEARFAARNLWTAEGPQRSLRVGFEDLNLEQVATEAQRHFDVVLDRPFAQDTTIVWKLPTGAQVAKLPVDVDIGEPGLLHYSLRARAIDGGLEVTRRFELDQRRIDTSDYAAFRGLLREVQLAEARTALVDPGPAGEGR